MTTDHAFIITPFLWAMIGLNFYDEKLFTRSLSLINNTNITRYDAVLLNQVFNDLELTKRIAKNDYIELKTQ